MKRNNSINRSMLTDSACRRWDTHRSCGRWHWQDTNMHTYSWAGIGTCLDCSCGKKKDKGRKRRRREKWRLFLHVQSFFYFPICTIIHNLIHSPHLFPSPLYQSSSFAVATYVGISAGAVGGLVALVVVLIIVVRVRRRRPKERVPEYLTLRRAQVCKNTRANPFLW